MRTAIAAKRVAYAQRRYHRLIREACVVGFLTSRIAHRYEVEIVQKNDKLSLSFREAEAGM